MGRRVGDGGGEQVLAKQVVVESMNGGDDMYEALGSVAFFAAHVTERTHGGLSPLSHSASTSRVCSWHYCTITSRGHCARHTRKDDCKELLVIHQRRNIELGHVPEQDNMKKCLYRALQQTMGKFFLMLMSKSRVNLFLKKEETKVFFLCH